MINPQYTYDNFGKTVGVFLPISDWDQLTQIPEVKELALNETNIPQWQVELGIGELKHIDDGTAELLEWTEARNQLRL